MKRSIACLCALLLAALSPARAARATTIEVGPSDDYVNALKNLQAGDELILDAGTYPLSSILSLTLSGTQMLPITIRAKAGTRPELHFVDDSQNIVNFNNPTFVVIDGLDFSGGSRGLRFTGGSDVTVRNCHVHDTADVAIAANDTGQEYARFTFEHNEVDHTGGTGEGFYLGCNDDLCRIHDSVIANNYVHDLNGPSVMQGDGIEIKRGSYANVVRDNVVHDTLFPGILVYDVAGRGAQNVVERNLVWNSGDNGIQATADAIVRNNIVLSTSGASGIAANALQGANPGNLVIANNTVIAPIGNAIRINSATGAVTVANNALYAPMGNAIQASTSGGSVTSIANAGQGSLSGVAAGFAATGNLANDFFAASLSGAPPQNLVPKGALLPGNANAGSLPTDDFALVARGGQADIGAYRANAAGNPGWRLRAGFKVTDAIFISGIEAGQ